jgi:hypothetical protein
MVRYQTGEGKIEIVSTSNNEQTVKDTIKKRGFDCHTGYIVEFRLTNYEVSTSMKRKKKIYN